MFIFWISNIILRSSFYLNLTKRLIIFLQECLILDLASSIKLLYSLFASTVFHEIWIFSISFHSESKEIIVRQSEESQSVISKYSREFCIKGSLRINIITSANFSIWLKLIFLIENFDAIFKSAFLIKLFSSSNSP